DTQPAQVHAFGMSMRYPEIDIVRLPEDIHAVGQNAIKTISWITVVDDKFVDELGGIASIKRILGDGISCTKMKRGYLFRIGVRPSLSDRNRQQRCPEYAAMYEALKPLIEVAADQSQWLDLGGSSEDEQTRAWYKRFEP
ncbi:MAG: DUF3396 domain-containing protein, partial [Betaproteobacteria bacterium]|nr:DUF3396 domain-containing protein [Betaproteobacteria bacterium]